MEGFLRQGPQLYRARQHRRNRKILWLRSCARALMVLAQVTLSAADFPGRQCGATDSLVIAGVPDLWQGEPDVAAAAAGVGPNQEWILMAHQPGGFPVARDMTPHVGLQVSGHVHA